MIRATETLAVFGWPRMFCFGAGRMVYKDVVNAQYMRNQAASASATRLDCAGFV